MTTLDLSLFGGFGARAADVALAFPTRKAQALLAYLALGEGRSFERGQLSALLWGEAGSDQAHSSLRQTLFNIRKALPEQLRPALVSNARSVSLDPAFVRSDALELLRIVAAPRRELLERVTALYRGPLLDGLSIDEPGFEDWLRVEQNRFAELASGALTQLAQREAEAGALPAALQTRLQLARLAAWDEDNHRQLMQLYVRLGRRSAALAQYKTCVEILQRDLGVEPELSTQRLYKELAAPEAALVELPASNTPSPAAPLHAKASAEQVLVGRERELAVLRAALGAAWTGAGKVALLVGEAGVGKTSLLDALAREVVAQGGRVFVGRCFESEQVLPFAPWVSALRVETRGTRGRSNASLLDDESLWCSLSSESRAALARLVPRGAPVDDVPLQDNALHLFEAYFALLTQLSQEAPLLLVLDDLHWADDMSLRLLSFLGRRLCGPKAAGARIFISATVRKEELARGHVLSTALGELEREDSALSLAVEPFSERDTSLLVRALTEAQGGVVEARSQAQIWSLSEGNPFVIVEAVRALTVGALGSEESELPVPARVREVIAGHIGRLSLFQRQLTELAAVIGRAFDLSLLSAVGEHDALETAAKVEDLVRVGIFKASGDKLYFSHERIREVVYESLLPQRRCALHGHVARTLLSVHGEALAEVYGSLAFHFVKADERRSALTYLAAFADHAAASFGIPEAMTALADASQLARGLPPADRAGWLLELDVKRAKCLFHLGRFADIAPCLAPHLPLLDTLQRPDLKAQVHFWIGCANGLLGDTAAAASGGARALEEALRCGGVKAARRAHTLLAWEAAFAGRFEQGIEHGLAATVSLSSADAEIEYQAAGFMTAGLNYLYLGRHRQALASLETAVALARENGVARVQALSLGYVGLLYAELADEALALSSCTEAVALAPDPVTATGTLSLLLHTHVRIGNAEQAKATFARLVAKALPLGQRTPQGGVLIALAEAHLLAGQAIEARRIAQDALGSARAACHPLIEGAALRLLGQSALLLGEAEEAEARLAESRTLLAELGAAFQLGRTLCALAALARERGDTWREQLAREEAERLYDEHDLPVHAARVGEVSASMGHTSSPALRHSAL